MRNDFTLFNLILFNFLPDIHYLSPWKSINSYWLIYEEKYELSQYLYDNSYLSPELCFWDAQHLELEANLILHLTHLMVKLNQTLYEHNIIKTTIHTYPILKEIRCTIGTIISVEKA